MVCIWLRSLQLSCCAAANERPHYYQSDWLGQQIIIEILTINTMSYLNFLQGELYPPEGHDLIIRVDLYMYFLFFSLSIHRGRDSMQRQWPMGLRVPVSL